MAFLQRTTTGLAEIARLLASRICPVCEELLFPPSNLAIGLNAANPPDLVILFLCRHLVHAHCVKGGDSLPRRGDDTVVSLLRASSARGSSMRREAIGSKIA